MALGRFILIGSLLMRALLIPALAAALFEPTWAVAQGSERGSGQGQSTYWWVGAILVATAASDARLERTSLTHRSPTLDDLASAGNALGLGRHLIPALGASYLGGRLTHRPRIADGALHAAAAYVIGNVVVSVGKPLIGRHRPDTLGSPWRIRPFTVAGAWHSFPSAHTLHAFTLAGAISEEARQPWVTAAAYGAASVVAWSRVYADEHWASDVAASAVIGSAIGHVTVRRLHARAGRHRRVGVAVQPRGAVLTFVW
jgi:membrane-associated phospholipid phosphatase